MRGISFAYTTPPLLAGVKSVTWRNWDTDYAKSFKRGEVCTAWDRSPRVGGKKVGEIEIRLVHQECSSDLPDEFWVWEGMRFLFWHPDVLPTKLWGKPCNPESFSFESFCAWRRESHIGFVVEFRLLRTMPGVRTVY